MKIGQLQNIEIKDNSALININPEIYSLSAIFNAAYVMLDKAFILIDGHPSEEILVEISAKDNSELLELVKEFNEELINYVNYEIREQRDQELKKAIMQKAMIANDYEKYLDQFIFKKKPFEEETKIEKNVKKLKNDTNNTKIE
jgi:His-Xaa-Ser system protein HxsD